MFTFFVYFIGLSYQLLYYYMRGMNGKYRFIDEWRRLSHKIYIDCKVDQIIWAPKYQTHRATWCGLDMEVLTFHGVR